jgi:hypothetical protein
MKMAKGQSLRSVAKELGYAPSTLSKHLNHGVFKELPQGGFDIEEVRRGLLNSTLPNRTHAAKLQEKPRKGEHLPMDDVRVEHLLIRGSNEVYWLLQQLWEVPEIYADRIAELMGTDRAELVKQWRETVWMELRDKAKYDWGIEE